MRTTFKSVIVRAHDLVMTMAAVLAAFALRFPEAELARRLPYILTALPLIGLYALAVYNVCGLYRGRWRFASIPDLVQIVRACAVMAMTMLVADYVLISNNFYGTFFVGKMTILLYGVLQVMALGGPRMAYRYWRLRRVTGSAARDSRIPVLVIGKQNEADSILQAIETQSLQGVYAQGILTPKETARGETIRGIRILGSVAELDRVVDDFAAQGIKIGRLIATASALVPEAEPERLLSAGRRLALPIWRVQQTLEDGDSASQLAPIDIESLLLRDSVTIDRKRLGGLIAGQRIAVTGGGGSIGSELAQRAAVLGAAEVLIIENAEPLLHQVLESFSRLTIAGTISGALADIRDRARMMRVLADFKPDLVIHAAALKHVPYLEADWGEAIKTNIVGSMNVLDAAVAAGAKSAVMISTDKAIDPVSILGVTKRFAELYAQLLDQETQATRVISVRFGNVLGSNGSVIPKFRAQIAAGGPVTVTDPDMVRYFMTVREASELVLSAASHAVTSERSKQSPSVYVLKMGQQVRIVDLAEQLIRLSGFEPYKDIAISFTGVRPGERLHEIMFADQEQATETGIEGVLAAAPMSSSRTEIEGWVDRLLHSEAAQDRLAAEAVFAEAVPNFHPARLNDQ